MIAKDVKNLSYDDKHYQLGARPNPRVVNLFTFFPLEPDAFITNTFLPRLGL